MDNNQQALNTQLIKIQVIDLARFKCEICHKEMYPSVLSTVASKWKYAYVCDECLINEDVIGKATLNRLKRNYIDNKEVSSFIDNSWIEKENIKGLFEMFLKMEKEDEKHVKHIGLNKAHSFIEGMEKGLVLYSEDEMINYFNFYDNNVEIVTTLQYLMYNNPKDKFIKNTYLNARTQKLSKDQLDALKRNKNFKFISVDTDKFWCKLEKLSNIVMNNTEDPEIHKINEIIDSVLTHEFYTEKQKERIDYFLKKYKIQ